MSLIRLSITFSCFLLMSQFAFATSNAAKQNTHLSSYECPSDEVLNRFSGFDDLALGEHHGTVETPIFVRCLVDHTIKHQNQRVIVSLEMPSSAREPAADFWRKSDTEDGRSSIAMGALVRHLVDLENKLLVDLHFQHRTRFFDTAEVGEHYSKNRTKVIGLEINELSQKGKVIALAGNIHTMKQWPESFQGIGPELEFEGQYFGESFTHIVIDVANGGNTWSCIPDCGIQPHRKNEEASRGDFTIDQHRGHDFVYYLDADGFTASPPNDVIVQRGDSLSVQ